jgi:hypothetical protein
MTRCAYTDARRVQTVGSIAANQRLSFLGGLRRGARGKPLGVARELGHVRGGTEEVGVSLVRIGRRIRFIHGFSVYRIICAAVNRRVPSKGRKTASTAEVVLFAIVNVHKARSRLNRVLEHTDPAAVAYLTLTGLRSAGTIHEGYYCEASQNDCHHCYKNEKIWRLSFLPRQLAFLPSSTIKHTRQKRGVHYYRRQLHLQLELAPSCSSIELVIWRPCGQQTITRPRDNARSNSDPGIKLRICWLQRLVDLVRRDRLAALNPVYEILQLRLPVHVVHQ